VINTSTRYQILGVVILCHLLPWLPWSVRLSLPAGSVPNAMPVIEITLNATPMALPKNDPAPTPAPTQIQPSAQPANQAPSTRPKTSPAVEKIEPLSEEWSSDYGGFANPKAYPLTETTTPTTSIAIAPPMTPPATVDIAANATSSITTAPSLPETTINNAATPQTATGLSPQLIGQPIKQLPNDGILPYRFSARSGLLSAEGQAQLIWQTTRTQQQTTYHLSLEGELSGMLARIYPGVLRFTSDGLISSTGLQPVRYTEQRPKKAEVAINFNHSQQIVSFSRIEDKLPLPMHVQDFASLLMQLGVWADTYPQAFVEGATLTIPLARTNRLDILPMQVKAAEPITLMDATGGNPKTVTTLPLVLEPAAGSYEGKLEFWFYQPTGGTGYLPARFRITDNKNNQFEFNLVATQ
jgi:hypothetical protein